MLRAAEASPVASKPEMFADGSWRETPATNNYLT